MNKLKLPTVTLLCVDCLNVTRAINVIEHCKSLCEFGDIKLLTSLPTDYEHAVQIPPLNSLIAYSVFMLTDSYKYFETSHVLVVQRDGWILNTDAWNDDWLNYDYLGPLFVQYDHVGNGGFSLRSKSIMQAAANTLPVWDWTNNEAERIHYNIIGMYEDGHLSFTMKQYGFNYPTPEVACVFAQGGNPNPIYYREKPFGFHGAYQNINHKTGQVSPVCKHKTYGSDKHSTEFCNCTEDHINYLGSFEKNLMF